MPINLHNALGGAAGPLGEMRWPIALIALRCLLKILWLQCGVHPATIDGETGGMGGSAMVML